MQRLELACGRHRQPGETIVALRATNSVGIPPFHVEQLGCRQHGEPLRTPILVVPDESLRCDWTSTGAAGGCFRSCASRRPPRWRAMPYPRNSEIPHARQRTDHPPARDAPRPCECRPARQDTRMLHDEQDTRRPVAPSVFTPQRARSAVMLSMTCLSRSTCSGMALCE